MGEHLPCKQGVKGSNPFISRGVMKRIAEGFSAYGQLLSLLDILTE